MNKTLRAVAIAALSVAALTPAMAQETPWQVRVRAVNIDPANKDNTGLGLSVNEKLIPELDISYYFTPNFAAELILTYPQKHDIRSSALGGKIGSVKQLPPTLLAQYHFTNFGAFKPYVGAGVNYTRFSSVKWADSVTALEPSIKTNSWGGALQVGFDYALDKNWSLNVDVKKVYMKTDVSLGGQKIGDLKIDPILVGVGVGYRF